MDYTDLDQFLEKCLSFSKCLLLQLVKNILKNKQNK